MRVSHFPVSTPVLTKGKQTPSRLQPYSVSAFPPAFQKTARSQNYRAFLHSQCFPQRRAKPNPMPEAKASLRRQIHARILSTFPKPNKRTPGSQTNNKGSIISWKCGEQHHFQHFCLEKKTFWKFSSLLENSSQRIGEATGLVLKDY